MEQMITVVAGQPRCGTSLMMQMLHVGGMEVYADDESAWAATGGTGHMKHIE